MLKNIYYIMRHGESEANARGLIVSSPAVGISGFGLTERGRDQVYETFDELPMSGHISLIITSDFLRARQTAAIVGDVFGIMDVVESHELRERFFGDFDGGDDNRYAEVWAIDDKHLNEYPSGVESPESVKGRVLALIARCEKQYEGEAILLVSHGDTLQILQAVFSGISPFEHRKMKHLDKGELRRLDPDEGLLI